MRGKAFPLPFGVALLGIEALALAALARGDLRGAMSERLYTFLAGYALAFLCYALLLPPRHTPKGTLPWILAGALLFRLTLLPTAVTLSDDLYRYLWDGRVQQAGIDPYRYPPNAPEVAPLADRYHASINHPDLPTIYPPLSEFVFFVTDRIAHHPVMMKLPFLLCDLEIVFLLCRILPLFGVARERVVLYAWNPLVLVEFAGSGHNDTLGVLLLLCALFLCHLGHRRWAALLLALSFQAKLLALLFAPFLLRRDGKGWLIFSLGVILPYLPFLDAGSGLWRGLAAYAGELRFNDALFHPIHALVSLGIGEYATSMLVAKGIVGSIVLCVAIVLYRSRVEPFRATANLTALLLLTTTQLHPWYLAWILPFCTIFERLRGFLLLSATVAISYLVYIDWDRAGIWHEPLWRKGIEFLPPLLLLGWDLLRGGTDFSHVKDPST